MKITHIKIEKLCTMETVRYSGRTPQGHGTYTISLLDRETVDHQIQIELSLEALIQLKIRVDASLEHLKTH